MGHQDPKDKIFRRWYQSRHFTAPVEDIFKGREPRSDKKEALSMHPRQDRDAPPKLPKDLEEQLYAADKKIQDMLESRKCLMRDLDQAIKSNDRLEVDRIKAALGQIRRHLCARKATVTRQNYTTFRAEWFEARPGEILRSQGQPGPEESLAESLAPASMSETFQPDRRAAIEALYPEEGQAACSRLVALERLLEYCISNLGNMKVPHPKRKGQDVDELAPVRRRKRPYQPRHTAQKEESAAKRQKIDGGSGRPWTRAENKILEQHFSRLNNPSSISTEDWQEILALLPGRTKRGIILRSYKLRKGSDTTRKCYRSWTEAEILGA